MSKTSLSTLIAPPDLPKATEYTAGHNLADEVKMEAILSIAEVMEKGTQSTTGIMAWLSANNLPSSRPTAIRYRNLAVTLLAREHKPMNRENMRALQVGRVQYYIERVYALVEEHESGFSGEERDNKWYDTHAKLWSKLTDLMARLHAITGLNEITVNNTDDRKRIIFLRPSEQPKDATSHNTTPSVEVRDVTEGELVEPPPAG